MKYVVDTCIINKLVDGLIDSINLPADGEFVASHIQYDELSSTKDKSRRAILLQKFSEVINQDVPTETTICGLSRIGQCRLSDGNLFESLKNRLDSLNKRKENNIQDALIAEVAITNGYRLLTADCHLSEVAKQHGCSVIYWEA